MATRRSAFAGFLCICSLVLGSNAAACTSELSMKAGCSECTEWGYCVEGSVPVDNWLKFALKTQRELQIDIAFDHFIMLDSHNSFEARAYGVLYGANDTCEWPPPYPENCTSIGNHEFSIIDQLNLGIRGIEIDNWFCYEEMRIAHLGVHEYLGVCRDDHMRFSDLVRGIGEWLDHPENEGEIIRIYLNEKSDQGHNDIVNGVFEEAFGDRILSPADYYDTYGGVPPTIRQMREDGKTVIIAASKGADGVYYTHGDKYIFSLFFDLDIKTNLFTSYPDCGGKSKDNFTRVYSDTLNFPLKEKGYYSGEDTVGSIKDLTEYVKCGIHNPAMDMINADLLKTGVFTWAEGQPEPELTHQSCIMLNGSEHRWYVATDCSLNYYYACQSDNDPEVWTVSDEAGPYTTIGDICPIGYSFSVPHNGYRQQKLIESSTNKDVWLNYSPWLSVPPTPTSTADRAKTASTFVLLLSAIMSAYTTSRLTEVMTNF